MSHIKNLAAPGPAPFSNFWPFVLLFPFILALSAFISFHFGLLGLHFLLFWLCGPSFPYILALWAFISFHSGLVGFHFLSFWLSRGQLLGPPPTSCEKRSVFPMSHIKNLAAPGPASFSNFWPCVLSFPFILALWAFISFHFGFVGRHFLSFWHFGPSFPFILAWWAFISLHFGLVGLHLLSFWPCRPNFLLFLPFGGQLLVSPPHKLPKTIRFSNVPYKEFSSARPGSIFQFLTFCAFISFHFGLLGLHFLSFWAFGFSFPFILPLWASFPFILALWAFISFYFGLVGLNFLLFLPFDGQLLGAAPQVAKNGPFSQCPI